MIVQPVDERTSRWECDNPTFRVYLFSDGGPEDGWATATYDVVEADVLGAIRWAQYQVGESGIYAVALVSRDAQDEPGLTWLVGMDANDSDAAAHEAFARMLARRGRRIVTDE
jgi:hypothetical protein